MNWNHRVVKRTYTSEDGKPVYREVMYGVHEAYYDEKGKVFMITDNPTAPSGDSMEELKESLEYMTKALEHPILDYDNIPEDGAIDPFPTSEEMDNAADWD